jgi:hypothetical protein
MFIIMQDECGRFAIAPIILMVLAVYMLCKKRHLQKRYNDNFRNITLLITQ